MLSLKGGNKNIDGGCQPVAGRGSTFRVLPNFGALPRTNQYR